MTIARTHRIKRLFAAFAASVPNANGSSSAGYSHKIPIGITLHSILQALLSKFTERFQVGRQKPVQTAESDLQRDLLYKALPPAYARRPQTKQRCC